MANANEFKRIEEHIDRHLDRFDPQLQEGCDDQEEWDDQEEGDEEEWDDESLSEDELEEQADALLERLLF